MLRDLINSKRRLNASLLGAIIILSVAAFVFSPRDTHRDPELNNRLVLGAQSKIKGELPIPSIQREIFTGLEVSDILALRRQSLELREGITAPGYRPSPLVFGKIEDEKPWYSEAGFYYGGRAGFTEGPTKESLYILNPYLLIGAEFWGATIHEGGAMKWRSDLEKSANLKNVMFPFFPKPVGLIFEPAERRARVSYRYSEFIFKTEPYTTATLPNTSVALGLVAYNARDLGFNFIQIKDTSFNIDTKMVPFLPFQIVDELSGDAACGENRTCNGRVIENSPLHLLTITQLPARLVLNLWRNDPKVTKGDADLEYTINIE